MAHFYLDTSAVVKRYRTEPGTDVMSALLEQPTPDDRFYVSFLLVLEFTSGILRLAVGGQVRQSTADGIIARFRQDARDLLRIWPLDDTILGSAISVVHDYRLRSADAIHLATALAISSVDPNVPLTLVTSDEELAEAGQAAGLEMLTPGHPEAMDRLNQIRGAV